MPVTLTFHDSQYPARLAEQVCQGLGARKLPGKLLYESPAQAQRWLAYHQAYSPSRTEPTLLALYDQAFQAALQALSLSALHYISLGCGGGNKDALFLQQAAPHCPALVFTPMDTSAALVVETLLRIQSALPTLTTAPLVVDLDVEPALTPWLSQHETPAHRRLLACFGMLPNFAYPPRRPATPVRQSLPWPLCRRSGAHSAPVRQSVGARLVRWAARQPGLCHLAGTAHCALPPPAA